jgi:hypothetical protein
VAGRRIVLVEMATEDAEEFARSLDRNSALVIIEEDESEKVVEASVEAVVARPTRWCQCAIVAESRYQRRKRQAKRESGWMRGQSFGWWLCASCGKPSRAVVMHWVTSMLAGANDLLPKILGTGAAIDPTSRWERDGGIPNEHATANSIHIKSTVGGPSYRSTRPRKEPNPRRGNVPH